MSSIFSTGTGKAQEILGGLKDMLECSATPERKNQAWEIAMKHAGQLDQKIDDLVAKNAWKDGQIDCLKEKLAAIETAKASDLENKEARIQHLTDQAQTLLNTIEELQQAPARKKTRRSEHGDGAGF